MRNSTRFFVHHVMSMLLLLGCFCHSFGQVPQPLIHLPFNESGGPVANLGTVSATFARSATTPSPSTNVPAGVGISSSIDFGTSPGNYYVESSGVIDALKNLNAFTLTGWINNRSSTAGSGGNRIISWINNGGEGVDLVYQSNGSLRLGVDGWPDNSPAFSSANKVPTNSGAAASNWTFFAVTYQSNGQVSFYFGNNAVDAALDVTRTYSAPGVTGSNINRLAIGAFNIGTRNPGTYDRMFRGLIDNIQIYSSALSLSDIIAIQRPPVTPPSTSPLIVLPFNESGPSTSAANTGSIGGSLVRSANVPTSVSNVPAGVGGANAIDFGTTPGNNFIQSSGVFDPLKNLSGFTLTGWLNNRSSAAGSGGNRIISWINNGGDGVDLVYQNNGSLRLGVDGWPDNSPAFSSANKIPTNAAAPASNWTFFAVTYQSNGQVQFYFGNNATDATLDVTRSYPGPGVTGINIGKLAIGAFNDATRNPGTYDRMFRGLIDDVQIFNSVLDLTGIRTVQRGTSTPDTTPPTAPGNLTVVDNTATTISLSWTASTDNVGVTGYEVYDGATLLDNTGLVTSRTLSGLVPGTTYNITVKAKDAAKNFSAPSNLVQVIPAQSLPLVSLGFDEWTSVGRTSNVPVLVGPPLSLSGVAGYPSPDAIKSLNAFTITGWLNCKSNMAGPGGNGIVTWLNDSGTEGVELVYQSDGSLRLGVDGFASSSPAVSQPNRVTTDPSAEQTNWVFFAVTYQSNGQVQFYFSNPPGPGGSDATLDVTRTYPGPGVTGSTIGSLTVGYRMQSKTEFLGLIDEIQIYNSVLNLQEILAIQRGPADTTFPTTPGNFTATKFSNTTATMTWTPSTDNVKVTSYELYNGPTLLAVIPGTSSSYTYRGLIPGTTYSLSLKARDARLNQSNSSATVVITTESETPIPRVRVEYQYNLGYHFNLGALGGQFWGGGVNTNIPNGHGPYSASYGSNSENYQMQLENLNAFTLTGWLNCASNQTVSGGNGVISWINGGGDGVDLVYQSDGSLRLGVDNWAVSSPAISSPNKVTANAATPSSNWVFFAVTYRATDGLVQFYFGNNTTEAELDVTKSYPGRGITGPTRSQLALAGSNISNRRFDLYDGAFLGLNDDMQVFSSALTLEEIRAVQYGPPDPIAPTAPDGLALIGKTATAISVNWTTSSTDNVGVASYELFDGSTLLHTHVPNIRGGDGTSMTARNLTPNTTYTLTLKGKDFRGNLSPPSNTLVVTTLALPTDQPLVYMNMDGSGGFNNLGFATAYFGRSYATASTNVPNGVGGATAADFGTVPSEYYIDGGSSSDGATIPELRNLNAFTLTGWVNNKSNVTGSGGNRIISWINNGGDGVDLVYQSNGSLRLGVDEWPDNSPAFSSPNRIPTNAEAPASNWTFFAVTYQSNGQVQFYFGNNTDDALLDVTRAYAGRGVTGGNISSFAVGAFNRATREMVVPGSETYLRMFRGIIDEIQVYASVLTPEQIVQVQRGTLGGGAGGMIAARQESTTTVMDETATKAELYQNFPNPYSNNTEIGVFIPQSVGLARIGVTDIAGRELMNLEVVERGKTSVIISGNDLNVGMYFYRLLVDGKVVGVKRMVLKK